MQKERLLSLDVFRGFTIILMTLVNNPGSWATVYPQLLHAEWHGCTFADLVFPFFIFILGVAIPFAMPIKKFDSATFSKILTRSLRIFCLGWFLAFFNKIELFGLEGLELLALRFLITILITFTLLGDFTSKTKKFLVIGLFSLMLFLAFATETYGTIRIPGVLQRIGIVYFCIAILYLKTTTKTQIIIAITLLLGYWAMMSLIPIPGIGAPNFDKGTNFAAWIDSISLPNHMYVETKTWDPEGVLSTLPAIASGIIGMLIGLLLSYELPKIEISKKLVLSGLGMIVLGFGWSYLFPINKALWSSSYVVFTAGLATLCLAVLYFIIEIAKLQKWTKVFLFWGVNPMLVFFFSGIIPRVMAMIKLDNPTVIGEKINIQNYMYKFWIVPNFESPYNASAAGALIYIVIWSFILWLFYRKNLIFKV
jgi:predicted acyltransferase